MSAKFEVVKSNGGCWTVGFTRSDTNEWIPFEDFAESAEATDFADKLNGKSQDSTAVCVQGVSRDETGYSTRLYTVGYSHDHEWEALEDFTSMNEAVDEIIRLNG